MGHGDAAVYYRLRLKDVLVMAVASGSFIRGATRAGATSPLIGVDLLKHCCLVKKGQVPFKIKICIWDLLNIIPKALIILILHLAVL